MPPTEQLWESLERTLSEIEALQAIYDDCFTLSSSCTVLEEARQAVAEQQGRQHLTTTCFHATLDLQEPLSVQLSLQFPLGYPDYCAMRTSVLQWKNHTRAECERLTQQLQERAEALVGQEAVLDLVQYVTELILENVNKNHKLSSPCTTVPENELNTAPSTSSWSRRWIWVHHITDAARRKSILQEAREHDLGGYLKFGYPGVIVVEGRSSDCDDFVNWIKGSKSRPGGFGRNWGHHVRGEINLLLQDGEEGKRCFSSEFTELEDMRELGFGCKQAGVEDEFLAYVMQHQ